MAHKAFETVVSIGASRIYIAPGITNALFIDARGTENSLQLKYYDGGSMVVIGCTYGNVGHTFQGATLNGAALASLYAGDAFYLMGNSEALSINGPTRFYIGAINATVTGYLIRGTNE